MRQLEIQRGSQQGLWFVRRACWSSAFRLFRAANMLKHELQRFTFAKEKTRSQSKNPAPLLTATGGVNTLRQIPLRWCYVSFPIGPKSAPDQRSLVRHNALECCGG